MINTTLEEDVSLCKTSLRIMQEVCGGDDIAGEQSSVRDASL